MRALKCGYCFSTQVQIETSYTQRDVMVIRCQQCHKTTELDTENPNVDIEHPAQDANPEPPPA